MLTNRPLNNELRIFLVVILEYKSQRWSQLFLNQSGIVILNTWTLRELMSVPTTD